MDITEAIMLGIQASKNELCRTKYPKAICKKLTGTKKDKNAIESIKDWCSGSRYSIRDPLEPDWTPIILPNEPTKGHKIVGYQSRSRTDNKWFEVQDPRGFTLEINASTMVDLMKDNIIDHGVIQEECIWGYAHSPTLVSINGKTYTDYLAAKTEKESRIKVTTSMLKIGKTYMNISYGCETKYVYLGRANIKVDLEVHRKREIRTGNNLFLFATQNEYNNTIFNYLLKKTIPTIYETDDQIAEPTSFYKQKIEKSQSFEYPSHILKGTTYNRDLRLLNFDCKDLDLTINN